MYREDQSGSNFMMGVLTGALVGAGIALLFAPRAGNEMRAQLGQRYRGLADRVGEQTEHLRSAAGQWREQGRERMEQFSSRMSDRKPSTGVESPEAERFPSSTPSV